MKKLIKGIIEFRKTKLEEYRERFSKLAYGQAPDTLFIACGDSRVVPNTFASMDPGDLFVLRNVGNLVPPYHEDQPENVDLSVAATVEFAIKFLNVSDIVICGHSDCAAMRALLEKNANPEFPFLHHWLQYGQTSYDRFQKHPVKCDNLTNHNCLSQTNVVQQLEHLKTYPWVQERLDNNTLQIHGWWFDLATANVSQYDAEQERFILIDEKLERK